MRELDCDEVVELVTAYLDGALDDEAMADFVDHIAVCDGCERYLDQVRQVVRALGERSAEEPPDGLRLPDEARESLLAAFRDFDGRV